MAEANISVDQDHFSCPLCLDLLNNPVTINCGHSFCMVCINDCWDQDDQTGVYSCPHCRETFTPRPMLRRNSVMAEVVEKLKKTEVQLPSPAQSYTLPRVVECDVCTGKKRKAIKSCLVCLASYCDTHVKPHYQSSAFKRHKLVKAFKQLHGRMCPQHDKLSEIYCRTDQRCICYLCTVNKHKGHDTVAVAVERTEKQKELKKMQKKSHQRMQEKQKKVRDLKQAVKTLKRSAQAAVEDSEKIFTELIESFEKKRTEMTELIKAQEKAELSKAEELLKQLEQEIAEIKMKNTELEQLSHTEDHISFLQSFQSLCTSMKTEDLSTFTVNQHLSFDGVRKSLSDLKKRLKEFHNDELKKVTLQATAVHMVSSLEPKTRDDFLQYFKQLTLDPNTAHKSLSLSEKNRVVTRNGSIQSYSDHLERFDHLDQVLCKESVSARSYWEIEWNSVGTVYMSLSYKGVSRKGEGSECWFGHNNQSWALRCSTLSFWHNNIETEIPDPLPSRIGVYVDHSAGTLSFYKVSDSMMLLLKLQNTFTQPLYAGFWVGGVGSVVKLCNAITSHSH